MEFLKDKTKLPFVIGGALASLLVLFFIFRKPKNQWQTRK